MRSDQQRLACSAVLEFDHVRLSVRDAVSGEGCAVFLRTDSLRLVMRELRRVVRQLRQARTECTTPAERPVRSAHVRGPARRRRAAETPTAANPSR